MEDHNPLVSITVITYNSSKFVLETLESIKAQTYQNIELIVSDDCSQDNTVEICREWIEKNKDRFVNTHLITTPVNTGIPSNKNRALAVCKGKWIKGIAGDDALMEKCIQDNIENVTNVKSISVLFSQLRLYQNTLDEVNFMKVLPEETPLGFFDERTGARDQYNMLLRSNKVPFTPTSFISKSAIIDVGLYDEKYPLNEDYPMWLKLTKAGYKFYFLPKETVKYRKHANSVHNHNKKQLMKSTFIRNENLRKEYVYPNISLARRLFFFHRYWMSLIMRALFSNKSHLISRVTTSFFVKYLNPFRWFLKIKRQL